MSGWTPGPWSVPHFARADHSCNCGYVLSDSQRGMGAIATVHVSPEGEHWMEGDNEPPQIAMANARLIAASPALYEALEAMLAAYPEPLAWHGDHLHQAHAAARAALRLVEPKS